jgi:hypothetical protein
VRCADKIALVARFFDPAAGDPWRQELLRQYGVDWVFWGVAERAQGDFDPATAPYLRRAYDAAGYAIFEVAP